jgi:hypothetical protein
MFTYLANRRKAFTQATFFTYTHTWVDDADIQSNKYNGVNAGDGVQVASNDRLNPKGADFSIEVKDFTKDSEPDALTAFCSKFGSEPNQGFVFWYNHGSSVVTFTYTTNGTDDITATWSGSSLTNGVTYDIALIRSGSDLDLYIDNVKQGSTYNISTDVIKDNTFNFVVGNYETTPGTLLNGALDGSINQLRFSNVARSSTMPSNLTNDSNTMYLNTFKGANGSTPTLNTKD